MIDQEMLASLGGQVRRLRGHHPLVLDDPRVMWFVASGSAALFTSLVDDGLPVGPRRLLFRAGAASPLFPVTDRRRRSGYRLIALSVSHLTLLEVPLRRVDQVLAAAGVPFSDAIETWVNRLSSFMAFHGDTPGTGPITSRGPFALDAEQAVRGEPGAVRWVRVEAGTVDVLGLPELRVPALPVYLPFGADMWMVASEPARLTVEHAQGIDDTAELVRGLSLFHALVQRRLRLLEDADQSSELARLEEREARQSVLIERALHKVASVLNPLDSTPPRETTLLGAAALVGDVLGIEVSAPARSEDKKRVRDPLDAIARASRFRIRRVLLSGSWWKNDCGPLLAYREADNRPVAVLRTPGGRYEVVDPDSGERRPVTRAVADELAPHAVTFYRRLPDELKQPWRLVRFSLHGKSRDLLMVIGLAATTAIVGMLTPQAMALVLDNAIPDANMRLLIELGLALIAAAFGMALFGLAQGVVSIRLGIAADSESQAAMWDRLLRLRVPFFRRFSSGDLLARATAVSDINRELNGQTLQSLLSSLMLLLNLGLLYFYSARLAGIAVALGFVIAVVTVVAGIYIRRFYRELLELQGHFFGLVVQLVHAVSKLRVAGAERRAFALWTDRHAEQLDYMLRAQRAEDSVTVFNQAVPALGSILLFWFGVNLLGGGAGGEREALSVGTFLAFNVALGTFIGGATVLSNTAVGIMDTLLKARRVSPLLEAEPEVGADKVDPGPLQGDIALSNVEFRYVPGGQMVLDGVSVEAAPGEFVAFVGPSGSGKSTLFRLLLGFEQPEAGVVLFDGQDLAGLDVTAVRRQLGVVLQSGRISAGSIFDNIAGSTLISLDEAWEAAEDAALADDIREMPMEMHTVISEGGSNLSGGQRQRLFIARALATRPKILLLDEATSALDNRTQSVVSASLRRRKVTRLVVAHRLSTIRTAQRIYVLDSGRVVETGTFEELVAAKGLFASMMGRQVA